MSKLKRSAGRPVKPILSRDFIAAEALDFVTESGIEKLTMGQLAKQLGVAPSALYNHLDSKADLVLLIQDALVSRVSVRGMKQLIDGETSLAAALEEWARSYRAVFAAYPSLIPLIAVTPVSEAPQTSQMYDTVAEALITAGIPENKVLNVIVAFESFLFGSALDVNAPADILDAGDSAEHNTWLARAVDASQADKNHSSSGYGNDSDGAEVPTDIRTEAPFRFGLDALISQTLTLVEPTASGA